MSFTSGMTVHKFGGTSLQDANAYARIPRLLKGYNEALIISASANTTQILQQLIDHAKIKKEIAALLTTLKKFQQQLIADLLEKEQQAPLLKQLEQDIVDIHDILHTIDFVADYTQSMCDRILGYGELWSTQLMAAFLGKMRKVIYIDATSIIFISVMNGIINIDWQRSRMALENFLHHKKFDQLIITGFIASTTDGVRTTLGRNGSDFSAAIFANLLDAAALIKWTDVDGICSADPHKVKSAFTIRSLSYHEALELAYFGTDIIHPRAVYPVIAKQIPIYIKNTWNPEAPGTYISAHKNILPPVVRGLSSIDHVALVNIEGSGMIGVSGVAARVFQQLHLVNISVILISQASSEHSICFAVSTHQAALAVQVLKNQFFHELNQKQIEAISADNNCAILAAVGDNMVGNPGIAGKIFSMLARANINIRAISQGSSERNISVVVHRHQIVRALRVVHSGFYLSKKTISIGVIGPGNVGSTFLSQLQKSIPILNQKYSVNILIRGIMNSKKMLVNDNDIDLSNWKSTFEHSQTPADFSNFIEHIVSDDIPHAAIIDCSSSQTVTEHYPTFFKRGLHLITPNKKGNSGDYTFYHTIKTIAKKKHCHYLYETTVCAGLPIIKTLQDLIQTGDEEISIEGIVSGTLAYIFDKLSKGRTFSQAVLQAYQLGYTEPDPRDDLTGLDIARKFTCLARELGYSIAIEDIAIFNLVPPALRDVSKEQFLEELPQFDHDIQQQMQSKCKKHEKLYYVGSITTDGKVTVDIKAYSANHPFFNLKGTDNIIVFTTKRYRDFPLVIQGPGAGKEVTAAGVFADLLRLISFLTV
ncbi:MAG: bifunctional aspartate kinase/homoserine dehydrogenase I [Coxiella sp. RIFCSPHIGHO2_12_FULL_44_14]|nr:MAG: bifunctional aspartate kinase/homoserine dehydrogenase I [Coxiella sp. RIFCSPHIGHO2_12_FULL_44_14]